MGRRINTLEVAMVGIGVPLLLGTAICSGMSHYAPQGVDFGVYRLTLENIPYAMAAACTLGTFMTAGAAIYNATIPTNPNNFTEFD